MANSSYCRFENTLADLRDCHRAMTDNSGSDQDMSYSETRSREKLLRLCAAIAEDFEDEIAEIRKKYRGGVR